MMNNATAAHIAATVDEAADRIVAALRAAGHTARHHGFGAIQCRDTTREAADGATFGEVFVNVAPAEGGLPPCVSVSILWSDDDGVVGAEDHGEHGWGDLSGIISDVAALTADGGAA